jgi:hypothetical protein
MASFRASSSDWMQATSAAGPRGAAAVVRRPLPDRPHRRQQPLDRQKPPKKPCQPSALKVPPWPPHNPLHHPQPRLHLETAARQAGPSGVSALRACEAASGSRGTRPADAAVQPVLRPAATRVPQHQLPRPQHQLSSLRERRLSPSHQQPASSARSISIGTATAVTVSP